MRRAPGPGVRFDSNADSNTGELWRALAKHCELLTAALNFKMNFGEPWRTLADDAPANFKTAGRHPWRCRRTDRSRRAPASFESSQRRPARSLLLTAVTVSGEWRCCRPILRRIVPAPTHDHG